MKLIKYKFSLQDSDKYSVNQVNFDWVDLQDTNLFVGKNASGKTTLTQVLTTVKNTLLPSSSLATGDLCIELKSEDGRIFKYEVECGIKNDSTEVVKENLSINGRPFLERDESTTAIRTATEDSFIFINPPINNTVIQVRRDAKQHPFFEELALWAKGIYLIKFADAHPNSLLFGNNAGINSKEISNAIESLTELEKAQILDEFNTLGYEVRLINFVKEGEQTVLYIQQEGVKFSIRQDAMSQGMFRSLLLLIYLQYLIEKQGATLIIIDDLCEGLDYDRATILGKLVFAKMKSKQIQFISTSNDSFLMNAIDIKEWNIITRYENKITSFNYENSRQQFEQFQFTGLNNFQLFASNYLIEGK